MSAGGWGVTARGGVSTQRGLPGGRACLPRGCLPRGYLHRWCLPRGCLPRGCLHRGCLSRECLSGVSAQGWGVSAQGRGCLHRWWCTLPRPRGRYSPVDRMTHACENIIFPRLLLRTVINRANRSKTTKSKKVL